MNLSILGVGIWARGLTCYADLVNCITKHQIPDEEFVNPKPEAISSRERRRAGLMINLAVTAAHQACEHADVDKAVLPSVFTSVMGDTDITDYMCRKLAQPDKLLSPTKFHNSVHNAPAGYWSISAGNRCPSTFVTGGDYSFGASVLEAASQAFANDSPVLLVAYDIANTQPFQGVCPIRESIACAFVLAPEGSTPGTEKAGINIDLQFDLTPERVAPEHPDNPHLLELADSNPMGVSLSLLEQIVYLEHGSSDDPVKNLMLPAADQLSLSVQLKRRS